MMELVFKQYKDEWSLGLRAVTVAVSRHLLFLL